MTPLRTIAREILLYLPGKFIPAIMAVVAVPLYSRFFTPEQYGRYDLTFRVALFLIVLTVNWLDNVIIRFAPAARSDEEFRRFRNAIDLLRYAGIAVGLAVMAGIATVGPDAVFGSIRDLMLAGAAVYFSQALFGRGLAMLRAQGRAAAYSWSSGLNAVLRVALGLALAIPLAWGEQGLLWAMTIVPLALYFVWMRGLFGPLPLHLGPEGRSALRAQLAYGLPVAATMVLTYIQSNLDRFMLKGYASDADVGVYAIGVFVGDEPVNLIYSTLMLSVFPTAARVFEHDGQPSAEVFNGHLTRIYLLVCAPLAAILAVTAQPLMQIVAGEQFHAAWSVVPYAAAAAFATGFAQYAHLGLHLAKRTAPLVWVTALGVAVNIAVNLLLIPRLGIQGCAIARLASCVFLLAAFAIVSNRAFRWHFPVPTLLRSIAAAAAAVAAGLALQRAMPPSLLVLPAAAAAAGAAYAAVLLLLREFSRREFDLARNALLRRIAR